MRQLHSRKEMLLILIAIKTLCRRYACGCKCLTLLTGEKWGYEQVYSP